jgi:hypothetical protein
MKSYWEFINENDNISKSISGMDRFGIGHDYKLYMAIIYDNNFRERGTVYFFPSEKLLEDFIVKRFKFNKIEDLDKYMKLDTYFQINDTHLELNKVGDGTAVNVKNGLWLRGDDLKIFSHDKIHYIYCHYQVDPNDNHNTKFNFELDESKLDSIEKDYKHYVDKVGYVYEEFKYEKSFIDLKKLIDEGIYSFDL